MPTSPHTREVRGRPEMQHHTTTHTMVTELRGLDHRAGTKRLVSSINFAYVAYLVRDVLIIPNPLLRPPKFVGNYICTAHSTAEEGLVVAYTKDPFRLCLSLSHLLPPAYP